MFPNSVPPSTNVVSLTYPAALSPAHGLNFLTAKINLNYIQQRTLYLTENRPCLQYKNTQLIVLFLLRIIRDIEINFEGKM